MLALENKKRDDEERPLTSFLKGLEDRLGKDLTEPTRVVVSVRDVQVELPSSVTCLTTPSGGKVCFLFFLCPNFTEVSQVFLIGTAHVSQESVDDVKEVGR